MVDIWKFFAGDLVSIIDTDNKTWIGEVQAVFDKEEAQSEDDCIDILVKNGDIISFYQREIKNIMKIG